ncbi:EAL domain-containing protein [Deinococcus marmoris]|uniref:EAL domain-containing protein n=1 Tax=Deinococcus marmoris TaxID=249408 RepID=UPI0009DF91B0|nr:EAL domain-containing protein [Deinococcus marmoris]
MSDLLASQFHQATLDAITSSLVVLDYDGLIVAVNLAWLQFGRDNDLLPAHAVVGSNYFAACEADLSADGAAAVQGIRKVIASEIPQYFQIYPCHSPHEQRWFQLRVTSFVGAPYLMAIHEDVTVLQDSQRQIRENATLINNILESIQEACLSVDHEWRLLYLNSQMADFLGKPTGELQGQNLWAVLPEPLETLVCPHFHAAVREQRTACIELFDEISRTWFEMRLYPYTAGLTVYSYNINDKKIEEQAQIDRNTILEMTVHGQDLTVILQETAMMLERQWPTYACTVLLNQKGRLYTSAAPSLPSEFRQAVDGLEISEGAGICGTAALRGELVVVEDIAKDLSCADYLNLLTTNDLRACASLPIIDGSKVVLGTMALYGRVPGPFPEKLLQDLKKASHLAAVAIEHHLLSQHMIYQSKHDALTGLANRVLFGEQLQDVIRVALTTESSMALLFIDVNDFKGVNDSLGHLAGDQVLVSIAQRLLACMRPGELLARMGGDEFTVVLPFTNRANAVQMAQRCLDIFALPFVVAEREIYLTTSIGISLTPEGGRDAETLQRNADLAMYYAKSNKLGMAIYETVMSRHAYDRFEMINYLRPAVEMNEFELLYQPQVQLVDWTIVGVEALLRWNHPHLGVISPADFISLAEETGLIIPIGEWVLMEACRQGMRWRKAGHPPVRIAVNVSSVQFQHAGFVEMVAACLHETGLPSEQLELELTERLVMQDTGASVRRMQALRHLGVSISIDDFGTGFSSLSYLVRLPINLLKIDRSFVTGLSDTSTNFPVVKAILDLAKSLNLGVIAEGVETPEECRSLEQLGCSLGQGYLFARPQVASEIFSSAARTDAKTGVT